MLRRGSNALPPHHSRGRASRRPARRSRSGSAPYLFLIPNLIIFGAFTIIPAFYNFYLGLFNWSAGVTPTFIGLGNFTNLNHDDIFWDALRNTTIFVVGDVGLMVVFSVSIALLLNARIVYRGFFRSVFFYPVLLSPVAVALVWRWVLEPNYGVLNMLMRALGLAPQPWLVRPDYALAWIVIIHVWATVGFYTLIVLAGLQSIPPALYEGALVDGATGGNILWAITLPMLMPTVFAVLVLSLIKAFEVFDFVYVLTGGGPGFSTLTMVQYAFRAGFGLDQLGLGAAASLVLFLIVLTLTALQFVVVRITKAEFV